MVLVVLMDGLYQKRDWGSVTLLIPLLDLSVAFNAIDQCIFVDWLTDMGEGWDGTLVAPFLFD